MNGLYRMREPRSLVLLPRSSKFLFSDSSKLRKLHRPRPEFTAAVLRSVTSDDDGVTHSGISLDGTQIWKMYTPILWIYDLEEFSDVPTSCAKSLLISGI